jgi:hypothetical protein
MVITKITRASIEISGLFLWHTPEVTGKKHPGDDRIPDGLLCFFKV